MAVYVESPRIHEVQCATSVEAHSVFFVSNPFLRFFDQILGIQFHFRCPRARVYYRSFRYGCDATSLTR